MATPGANGTSVATPGANGTSVATPGAKATAEGETDTAETVVLDDENANAPTGSSAPALSGTSETVVPVLAPTPKPAATPLPFNLWTQTGLEYRCSLGAVGLSNGQALSYMPLELGWRFATGWCIRMGCEVFYYEGQDTDATTEAAGTGPEQFSYSMLDVRCSVLHVWRRDAVIHPLLGVSLDSIMGSRQISADVPETSESAGSSFAPGVECGVEYRGGPGWIVSLEGRGTEGFGTHPLHFGVDIGWSYLFRVF